MRTKLFRRKSQFSSHLTHRPTADTNLKSTLRRPMYTFCPGLMRPMMKWENTDSQKQIRYPRRPAQVRLLFPLGNRQLNDHETRKVLTSTRNLILVGMRNIGMCISRIRDVWPEKVHSRTRLSNHWYRQRPLLHLSHRRKPWLPT